MTAPPLVMFDTNILFDFFLGRDPQIVPLVQSCRKGHVAIHIPEFVLFEFRGSILRELGRIEAAINTTRALANQCERADDWASGVAALRQGCTLITEDITLRRNRLDEFIDELRSDFGFTIHEHTWRLHYEGDLRFVKGLPPDRPKNGVQDCRILEAMLDIARNDQSTMREARYLLTKDSDFHKDPEIVRELDSVGVSLVDKVQLIIHDPRF